MSAHMAFPGPDDITRVELPNGIVVLARANFNSPSVVISGYLRAGSLSDPQDKLGLADFTASMLMRGTAQHSFQQIYDQLESVGASLGFSGGTHTTSFGGRALSEDLDLILGLLDECLQQPVFPPDYVERLRAQHLTGLAIRAQDTAEMASLAFDEIVYAGHPYSKPEEGFTETVRAIQREDLVNFHNTCYGPQGCVIVITGDIEPQKAVESVAARLGDWSNPRQPAEIELPPLAPMERTVRREILIAGKSQADFVLGGTGPERKSPDFLPASLGNSVLGQFGMYGRIGESVRERAGLAYYAYSNMNGGIGPGVWYAAAGVDPANVDKTIDLVSAEFGRFTNEMIKEDELEDCKSNYLGRLPLSLESNAGVAGGILYLERHSLGLDYYYRYPDLVRAVNREQVLEVARHYIKLDRQAVAIAGP